MPHKRGKRPRYVVEVEDPGGSCSLSTPSELGNTFTFKIRHSTERTGSGYSSFMQLHFHMLIFLQNRIIQQSSEQHSPTGLGLHSKWSGNVKPGLQKLSLTRVLSTSQDQANTRPALVLIHSMAFHPFKRNSSAKDHPIAPRNRRHQSKLCWKTPKAATTGQLAPYRENLFCQNNYYQQGIHTLMLPQISRSSSAQRKLASRHGDNWDFIGSIKPNSHAFVNTSILMWLCSAYLCQQHMVNMPQEGKRYMIQTYNEYGIIIHTVFHRSHRWQLQFIANVCPILTLCWSFFMVN